ncbi:MAG: hypothetical protein EB069_08000 [Actinobacteria bacterium]|nr:hypothetical protein [Actinomycetota bacterium]
MALEDFTGDCSFGLSANIASTLATFSRDIETEKLGEVRRLPLFLGLDVYINQQVTCCLLETVLELLWHPPGFANPAQRAEKI